MPISKCPPKSQPPWKEWDQKAQKNGLRHQVHAVNGDCYVGEWKDNMKHGESGTSRGSGGGSEPRKWGAELMGAMRYVPEAPPMPTWTSQGPPHGKELSPDFSCEKVSGTSRAAQSSLEIPAQAQLGLRRHQLCPTLLG